MAADRAGACPIPPVCPSPPAVQDCLANGTCVPIQCIGSVSGVGDSTNHIFHLYAGVYRMTLTGGTLTSADLTRTTLGRKIFYYDYISSDSVSTQEIVTARKDDAGAYILEIDDDKNMGWSFLIERVG